MALFYCQFLRRLRYIDRGLLNCDFSSAAIYGGGGDTPLDHNSQLFFYPISRSQVCPDVRSQSQVSNQI